MLTGGLPHNVSASDTWNRDGARHLVIHNIGRGTKVEETPFDHRITGHHRFGPLADEVIE
jgi:uncharacterized protein